MELALPSTTTGIGRNYSLFQISLFLYSSALPNRNFFFFWCDGGVMPSLCLYICHYLNFVYYLKLGEGKTLYRWQLHLLPLAVEVVTNLGSPFHHSMEVQHLRELQLLICQSRAFAALTSPSALNVGMLLDLGILFLHMLFFCLFLFFLFLF